MRVKDGSEGIGFGAASGFLVERICLADDWQFGLVIADGKSLLCTRAFEEGLGEAGVLDAIR